jgi:hypothetical protein
MGAAPPPECLALSTRLIGYSWQLLTRSLPHSGVRILGLVSLGT